MSAPERREHNPWLALAALCIGFFMILVDVTIVSVAQKAIMADLRADLSSVVWVTSAYLLAGSVPLLVSGRLGDRFGQGRVYLAGLVVFTASSAWCGCSATVGMLIAARAVQGLGSAFMTPQTMAIITRIFPSAKLGAALGAWGATAGFATLFGPLAGGVIVDRLGWQWIFFINVPVGVAAFAMATRLLPPLPICRLPFDFVGFTLSGLGLFALVLGLLEGERWDWDARPWLLILGGVLLLAGFAAWEGRSRAAPLMPLALFRDRNFAISSLVIATVSFMMSGFMLPVMLYLQIALGFSAVHAALTTTPMALASGLLSPLGGRLADRFHPRNVIGIGVILLGVGACWFAAVATADADQWRLMAPMAVVGMGAASTYAPIGAAATRNLPGRDAGVYNTSRMVGAVLGSASVGALMQALAADKLPPRAMGGLAGQTGALPEALRPGFASAMSQSMLLCVVVLAFGVLVAVSYGHAEARGEETGRTPAFSGH
ncbi:DHA2 family efflux MFS transporter permease subunit [Segniliparus rugosus]|uniref:Drug:H+ antiporter-2 (14 Spanner) (DHA2) family drug resistance MFS transporter n=1 Tax=Segniliparus rugosus (strain ATCC BAA-974 / DSM 45345 / CCUG 50838 / CIP 108380 / JCM 13579 / CDC 945) TaxID=679197 RepID=E5XTV9_SEGRC|nr:DHA2 family efflux MFS transporter permease subunit [Segniliparus rugosus]EFV12239.1 drug:H+ antiporter-2 (14 Spanner) (DHA2) family drug resistance MFS transporter [Segniliparus rugosus ATCC BAA-974]